MAPSQPNQRPMFPLRTLSLAIFFFAFFALLAVALPVEAGHTSHSDSHARRSLQVKHRLDRAVPPFRKRDGPGDGLIPNVVNVANSVVDPLANPLGSECCFLFLWCSSAAFLCLGLCVPFCYIGSERSAPTFSGRIDSEADFVCTQR